MKERISIDNFMILFCVINFIQKNYTFNKKDLFNFANDYSLFEYEKTIQDLQNNGILYTIDYDIENTIHIHKGLSIQNMLKDRISYLDNMITIVDDYNKYEMNRFEEKYLKNFNQINAEANNTNTGFKKILSKKDKKEGKE